jgi:hypothetical protein
LVYVLQEEKPPLLVFLDSDFFGLETRSQLEEVGWKSAAVEAAVYVVVYSLF